MIETKEALEQFVCKNWNHLNAWFDEKYAHLPLPLTTSVDIREGREKFAPVDANIYPAGFNNLCLLDLEETGRQFYEFFKKRHPDLQQLAILPESNTKNTFYLDNLAFLAKCLKDVGLDPFFVSPDQQLFGQEDTLSLISASGIELTWHRASIEQQKVHAAGISFEALCLNNDQSLPLSIPWQELTTAVYPSPAWGWYQRKKSAHFKHYQRIVTEFCEAFDVAPRLLEAQFKAVDQIDFASKEGMDELARQVDLFKEQLSPDQKIFVKADQGTYGMGISVVSSGEEVLSMNRRARNKMDIGKNKIKFTSVLLQEGVETVLKFDDEPAEISIYLVAGRPTGGFMRTNSQRDALSNLNAKGMVFRKFCISEIRQNRDHLAKEAVYSFIGRLSTAANACELVDLS